MLNTHCASARLAPNSRRRVGKAMLTTVESKIIMKMPNMTEISTFHFCSNPLGLLLATISTLIIEANLSTNNGFVHVQKRDYASTHQTNIRHSSFGKSYLGMNS